MSTTNQNELLLRLSEICDAVENGSASQAELDSLRNLSPQLCPADRREDWLDLQLMIQERPRKAAGSSWLDKLLSFRLRLNSPMPAWR